MSPKRTNKDLRNSRKRSARTRIAREHMLIVCEGSETEKQYFTDMKRAFRISTLRVDVVPAGSGPSAVLDKARKKILENKQKGIVINPAYVWCVFDRDDHCDFKASLEEAKRLKYRVAISHPCFELWFYLHFFDQDAHIDAATMKRCMKKCPGFENYQENMTNVFEKTYPNIQQAINRAEILRKRNLREHQTEHYNPSTNVDRLIDTLLKLKDFEKTD